MSDAPKSGGPEHANSQDGANSDPRWLDTPEAGRRIHNILAVVCALLFVGDFLYHKHVHFDFEGWTGFYPAAGFFSYVGLVFTAKGLRRLLKREEDYYD